MPPESSQPARSAVKESAPQVPNVQLRQAAPVAPVALGKGSVGKGRNLVLGICSFLLSMPLAGVAFTWAPRETFVAATTSMLLSLLMFLSLQLHLLIQRHGIFLLMAVGLLLTLAVPVGVRLGSTGLDWMADLSELSELRAARTGRSTEHGGYPVYVQAGGKLSQSAVSGSPPNSPPTLDQSGSVAPPALVSVGAVPGVAATPNFPTAPTLKTQPVSSQEVFSPESAKRAEQALLDQLMVKISREDPQAATRMAQKEMLRRYPALEYPSSKEANLYRESYNELGRLRKFEFFKDPLWPLKIAEMLAVREGWKRADHAGAGAIGVPQAEESSASAQTPPVSSPGAAAKALPGEELALDGPGTPPAEDSHALEVKRAMIEARKRYPAIGIEGSDENRAYVEIYAELDKLRPDFFSKGDWPIRLVELVAKREGWSRSADPRQATGPDASDLPLPR